MSSLTIDAGTTLEFPDGLIGLAGSRYALLTTEPTSAFQWLQSLEDAALALPVTNPHRFFADFRVEVTDEEADRLGIDDATTVDVFVTVRAGATPEQCTANLKAPILIKDGQAHQVINQAPGSELRAPLFGATGDTASAA